MLNQCLSRELVAEDSGFPLRSVAENHHCLGLGGKVWDLRIKRLINFFFERSREYRDPYHSN